MISSLHLIAEKYELDPDAEPVVMQLDDLIEEQQQTIEQQE